MQEVLLKRIFCKKSQATILVLIFLLMCSVVLVIIDRYIASKIDLAISQTSTKLEQKYTREIETLKKANADSQSYIDGLENRIKAIQEQQKKTSDLVSRGMSMRATAYDLSVASCGKRPGHPEYGVTKTGTRATAGRTVAVDPRVIPLGSTLYIKFPDEYKYLNGRYIAEDTGGAVRGNIIDIFLGENEQETKIFGIQKVKVYILN